MQVLCADPIDDTMPLNETDKAWIRETIRLAHGRHGWGKLTGFIKDWSGAGAAVAILVLFFTQWTGYVEFRTKTGDRLDNIEKTLNQITQDSTKQSLLTHAALPVADFKATLSDLRSTLAKAKQQNVKVSPKVIGDLQEKLIASTDAPTFWPAAAEFIAYRSLATTSWSAPKNLPICTDRPPTRTTLTVLSPTQIQVNPGVYENCRFSLDSPQEDEQLNRYLTMPAEGKSLTIMFKHCLIVYHGGQINLVTALNERNVPYLVGPPEHPFAKGTVNVAVTNAIEFRDCLFDIELQNAPPEPGQQITRLLLASTGTDVKLPLGKHS
jgi:hypothetical protein